MPEVSGTNIAQFQEFVRYPFQALYRMTQEKEHIPDLPFFTFVYLDKKLCLLFVGSPGFYFSRSGLSASYEHAFFKHGFFFIEKLAFAENPVFFSYFESRMSQFICK